MFVPAIVFADGVKSPACIRFDGGSARRAGRGLPTGAQPSELIIFEGSADRRSRVSKRFQITGSDEEAGALQRRFFGTTGGLAARAHGAPGEASLLPMRMFLNIGSAELVVVFVVAFILFGPQGVTDVARTAGRAYKTFKRISEEAGSVMDKIIEDDDFAQKAQRAVTKAASVGSSKAGPAAAAAAATTAAGAAAAAAGDAGEVPPPAPAFLQAAAAKGAAAEEGMAKRVIVIGPPACGKGTQCKRVAAELGYVHVCAGDLLREEVATGSETGLKIKSYMDMGWIVPGEITAELVVKRLASWDCAARGVVLDGYPRSVEQATALRAAGWEPDRVVLFEAPNEVLVRRVTGRRLDPQTGTIYHLEFNPPPQDDAELLARLEQRADDNEETMKTRLEQFEAANEAILSQYPPELLHIVNADKSADDVFRTFETILKPRPLFDDDEEEEEEAAAEPVVAAAAEAAVAEAPAAPKAGPTPAAVAAAAAAAGVLTLTEPAPVQAEAPPAATAAAGGEGPRGARGGSKNKGGRSRQKGGKGGRKP
eukprot:tig00020603_g11740.t1